MEKQKAYLLTLSSLLLLSTAAFAMLQTDTLDVYVSVFTISYFATSAVFSPRRRTFDLLGLSLFAIFAYIVALRVLAILSA
jgi:hypothetical protein